MRKLKKLEFYDMMKNDDIEKAKKDIEKYVNKKYNLNLIV